MKSFDTFGLKARIWPACIVISPLTFGFLAWFPVDGADWGAVVKMTGPIGLAALLAHLGRDLGRAREPKLFDEWGGRPSVRFLRHRDDTLNPETKARYHQRLQRLLPEHPAPSKRKETASPGDADRIYGTWSDWLKERTRDNGEFGLLYSENVGYNFRRNLWGMKAAGLAAALAGAIACAARTAKDLAFDNAPNSSAMALGMTCIALSVIWVFRIRKGWVRISAEAYALRLLSACERLEPNTKSIDR